MLSDYFKKRDGFQRLFSLLKQKYCSLGRYAGTVVVSNTSKQEAETLSNFLGRRIVEGSDVKTSFKEIEQKIKQTKYADFTWEDLFYTYFGMEIIPKKQIMENEKQEETEFFESIQNALQEPFSSFFEEIIRKRESIYHIVLKRYHKEKKQFQDDLFKIFQILMRIEELAPTSLPMLASITGDPHFLDFKKTNSTLFF